jgi:hypothetical protein
MKAIKVTLLLFLFSIITVNCRAQNYGTLRYWGKEYKLDRKFFGVLNENWNLFINGQAPNLRYYDNADYQDIYTKIVNNLTNPSFIIIVTESNQIQWQNAVGILPGTDGEKDRSKRSYKRASLVLYNVVLPALNQFMQMKEFKQD